MAQETASTGFMTKSSQKLKQDMFQKNKLAAGTYFVGKQPFAILPTQEVNKNKVSDSPFVTHYHIDTAKLS